MTRSYNLQISILFGVLAFANKSGIWEIYNPMKRKMPIVVRFYNYYNVSKHTPELKKAIQGRDWTEANKMI